MFSGKRTTIPEMKQSATLPSFSHYLECNSPCSPTRFNSPRHGLQSQNLKTSLELPQEKERVTRLVKQLKSEFVRFGRFSRKQSWEIPIKQPEQNGVSLNRQPSCIQLKQSLSELQQKIADHTSQHKLTTIKSQENLLARTRSIGKQHLLQKAEQCKKLCLEMKKKLLKQTVSTNASRDQQRSRGVKITDFVVGRLIGQGKFSRVHMVRHIKSGTIYALKVIKKSTIRQEKFEEQLTRQIKIQLHFNQVNIVRLYTVFHDATSIYLLLQYCVGGQLYDIFNQQSSLSEKRWAIIMSGICEGLLQMHQQHVIHRDLKPQNIMLSFGLAKLADLGWSVHSPTEPRDTFCGTPLYISPELLLGGTYNQEVDVWALGVMMYEFLTGTLPFPIQHETNLALIVSSPIKYPSSLSEDAEDLLRSILERNPQCRISIKDILKHPYLVKFTTHTKLPL